MKKFYSLFLGILCAIATQAQITYSNDTVNVVTVTYNGTSATVDISTNITNYVTPTISGGHVSIVQSADVSELTCGEITYRLTGSTTNGSFYMEGSYKATVSLYGVTITNPSGPAINIQNGKRIDVSCKKGTVSTLTDGAGGTWKGCLMCKGHLEFKGYGTLNIYGNTAHGIWSKEYIEIKNCTINIYKAVKDAINCNQYFYMESGSLYLEGYGSDGIQVSYETDDYGAIIQEAENTGSFTQIGGTIVINGNGSTGSEVKTEGTRTLSGGELRIITALNVVFETDEQVAVYNILGTHLGVFSSRAEAVSNLPKGVYILKSNTNTQKIILQ
ncbi:MAG: carbohydrate-binding domain-containing protein [Paludibacteraceae bacterium]|nr:carbohydrate-binding domain-containing protein [Paludibacteraceae bacterium]